MNEDSFESFTATVQEPRWKFKPGKWKNDLNLAPSWLELEAIFDPWHSNNVRWLEASCSSTVINGIGAWCRSSIICRSFEGKRSDALNNLLIIIVHLFWCSLYQQLNKKNQGNFKNLTTSIEIEFSSHPTLVNRNLKLKMIWNYRFFDLHLKKFFISTQ